MKKVCFTGNRPQKLPWGNNENDLRAVEIFLRVNDIVDELILKGYNYFISGMAQGIDIICAEIILNKRKTNNNLFLECALPCEDQADKWNSKIKQRHKQILLSANFISSVCNNYSDDENCMKKRNKYMVDCSDVIVAVLRKNIYGGAKSTVEYAKSNGKTVYEIIVE